MVFLRVNDLAKRLGGVQALRDVSLDLSHGEVHGLVGANGAGKSTLIRHLAGMLQPDAGSIEVDGVPVRIASPGAARALGFAFIHQELNLIQHFTVLENLCLGIPKPQVLGVVRWSRLSRRAHEVADSVGFDFSLSTPVSKLSVAQQWLVAIGRSLMSDARVIAMDEPTASLASEECNRLFGIIERLAASGVAVLYVSHRLDEVVRLCHRVTVFRDGRSVVLLDGDAITHAALVRGIVGRAVDAIEPTAPRTHAGGVIVELRRVSRRPVVKDVSLTLRAGEILGLGGLVGSGRSEIARMIFGADHPEAGRILVDGTEVRFHEPADAAARGIALVPEERRAQGLILRASFQFNVNLPELRRLRRRPWLPLIDAGAARDRARRVADRLDVQVQSLATPIWQLSGGNQQKVVIGKWLGDATRVIILDEPTRGVDIGARQEIYASIRELANTGLGVIMISSELPELSICTRVLVLSEGAVVGELHPPDISEAAILAMAYSARETKVKRGHD